MTKDEHSSNQSWLKKHREVVRSTDQLKAQDRYADILVLGLVGEVGSILSERKKALREQEAYPRHRHRLTEELGDALWYLLRILDTFGCDIATLDRLGEPGRARTRDDIDDALELGTASGDLLRATRQPAGVESIQIAVECVAAALSNVAARAELNWQDIAAANRKKILSRLTRTQLIRLCATSVETVGEEVVLQSRIAALFSYDQPYLRLLG